MKKLLVLAAVLIAGSVSAGDSSEKATEFKAEFIVDLIDNVEWTQKFERADSEMVHIYILGEGPVATKLQEFAAAESGKKKNLDVKIVSVNDDLGSADILYLASDDMGVLAKALKKLNGSHTLTVSDAKDFARYGVMINFSEEDGSSEVKLEINRLVLESAGAKLSSDLLEDAILI